MQQDFPDCENLPEENGNFGLVETTDENPDDDCNLHSLEEPFPPFTEEDLDAKKQHLADAYDAWQANPEDQALAYEHRQAEREKDVVFHWLLKEAIDHKNYEEADELLMEEGDAEAQRWRFSVQLMAKDFAAANTVLSHLPLESEDDVHFADIMAVNLQLWQQEAAFQLSAGQENRLFEIAYSQSPSRAYARSLLNLLKGVDFEPDEEKWGEPEPSRPAPAATAREKQYAISPNPASGEVVLTYPPSEDERQLQVIHLPTSRQQVFTLDGSGRFTWHTAGFSSGVYLLRFMKNDEVLHQEKAVVIKR